MLDKIGGRVMPLEHYNDGHGPDLLMGAFAGIDKVFNHCVMLAGSRYVPGSHPFSVQIIVLEGTGVFKLEGREIEYGPMSSFEVAADERHCFSEVKTNTHFLKSIV